MSYQRSRELARIRAELRVRLMSRRYDGTRDILRQLEEAAKQESAAPGGGAGDSGLRGEYERWRMRFEMLAESDERGN